MLDVNLLLALAWPSHLHHSQVQSWFAENRKAGFRTCPLTQIGFVRISSNPSFTKNAVAPAAALSLLVEITAMAEHDFWPDDLTLGEAFPKNALLSGHRQVTDAYLVGLTRERGGVLATLDRGILAATGGRTELVHLV